MKDNFDTQIVKKYLDKVCSDPQFTKSPRYTQLLSFLVEQALASNDLKEHVIGSEIFGASYNPVKDDGKVRVYMYNLRKKLTEYYSLEGRNDAVVFMFEKGSYNLHFIEKGDLNVETNEKDHTTRLGIKGVIVASVLGIAFLSILSYQLFKKKEFYCWDSFLSKKAVNTCLMANQLILTKEGGLQGVLFTKKEINSVSDYAKYNKIHADDSLRLEDYSFFTRSIPYSLLDITRLFIKQGADLNLLPESEFRFEKAKSSNIIYIGQYKTMSLSKQLFLSNSKIFKAYYNHFVCVKNGKEITYNAIFKSDIRSEYAMVSFMPLSNDNKALYFVSNNDIGTMATVDKFTDMDFLKEFYKKLPSKDSYFNALFKVEGFERVDASCELVELEIVE